MKISDFIDNKIVVPLITKAKKLKEKGTRFSDIVDKDPKELERRLNEFEYGELLDRLIEIEGKIDKISPGKLDEVYLNSEETAKVLKISPKTLFSYRSKGLINFTKLGQKIWYSCNFSRYLPPIQKLSLKLIS